MINTPLIKLLVLCMKLVFYSSGADVAEIDMQHNGRSMGKLSYKVEGKKMSLVLTKKKTATKILVARTIENALYKVELPGGDTIKIDLASIYTSLNWKKLCKTKKVIKLKHGDFYKIYPKGKKLYLEYKKYTFIIDKKLLKKKKK